MPIHTIAEQALAEHQTGLEGLLVGTPLTEELAGARRTTLDDGEQYIFLSDISPRHYKDLHDKVIRRRVTHAGNSQFRQLMKISDINPNPQTPVNSTESPIAMAATPSPAISFAAAQANQSVSSTAKPKQAESSVRVLLGDPITSSVRVELNVKVPITSPTPTTPTNEVSFAAVAEAVRPIDEILEDVRIKEINKLCLNYTKRFTSVFAKTEAELLASNRFAYREPRKILNVEFTRLYKHDSRTSTIDNTQPFSQEVKRIGMLDQLHAVAQALFAD